MKEWRLAALILLQVPAAWTAPACQSPIRYEGLGTTPGTEHALPFGEALFASVDTRERVVAFHPGGKELYFTLLGPAGPQIMRSSYRDGTWQPPTRASFSDAGINTEPSISPDGRSLVFISTRPPSQGTDVWRVERTADDWSKPVLLSAAINGAGYEWHPQMVASGDLYFAAADRNGYGDADLYVSRLVKGQYQPAQNLGPKINTPAAEWDAYVNPSGDYLIFKSTRPGGYGGRDLYVSRRTRDGWSPPKNLGAAVNTVDDEDAGEVTPDGRFLTFARSKPGAEAWKMMWIDARALGLAPHCR
jgi:Tol biopolymer transport system component